MVIDEVRRVAGGGAPGADARAAIIDAVTCATSRLLGDKAKECG